MSKLTSHLEPVFQEIKLDHQPAFWPIIGQNHQLYYDLAVNHANTFENKPYHFHNGGIWLEMNGWLVKGLSKYKSHELIESMKNVYLRFSIKENFTFSEYTSSDLLESVEKNLFATVHLVH